MGEIRTPAQVAERVQRSRVVWMVVEAVLFLAWQAAFWSSPSFDAPLRAVDQVRISGFVVWAALLLALVATGGGLFRGKAVRALLDDELTRAHRASSVTWGYWATMAACLGLYVVSRFEPVSVAEVLHLLLSVGVAIPLLRFVWLERRAEA